MFLFLLLWHIEHNVNFQKRVQYCVSAVSFHYIEHNSNFCYAHTHTNAATDVAIDSTQKRHHQYHIACCVYQCSIYIYSIKQIVQFTNSNVMRESKLSVFEWHMKACTGYDICMDMSFCCSFHTCLIKMKNFYVLLAIQDHDHWNIRLVANHSNFRRRLQNLKGRGVEEYDTRCFLFHLKSHSVPPLFMRFILQYENARIELWVCRTF